MKTYRRRFGVVAYQNTTNTTESLLEWWKDLGADVKKIEVFETDIGLKITIIFNADYDISFYLYKGDWIVYERGRFDTYTNEMFKRLFVENKEV